MARVYNFSAGPSVLPESVLEKAAAEMLDYQGSGQSVMEMSHRSKVYDGIIKGCEALLREVMGIPDNYKVLFLQGGASSQFAMVPLNLMNGSGKADFVLTGQWATKAQKEAARYGEAHVVASSKDKTFTYIPELDPAAFTPDADYFHICMNNTIYGTRFTALPETEEIKVMEKNVLSDKITEARAEELAWEYSKRWVIRKNRILHKVPEKTQTHSYKVYKPLYLFEFYKKEEERTFYKIMDSLTGDLENIELV